ncbi:cyclin-like protein, partial [Cytidiella melzeri]
ARRTTRTTRTTVVKDKENAVTRPLRTTRAKPPSTTHSSATDAKPTVVPRAASSTAATRAKSTAPASSRVDPGSQKRKREALGEVARPAANVRKDVQKDSSAGTDLKGKAKAKETFDAVPLKKPPSSAKPPSTTRQSLRVASSTKPPSSAGTTVRRGRSAVAQEPVKPAKARLEEPRRDEHAMAIDVPVAVAPVAAPRRFNVARSSIAVSTTRVQIQKRVYQASKAVVDEPDEEEAYRAYKKRRTSSDAPEDNLFEEQPVHKVEDEFVEADPNGDQWDDLDADDGDDPLMVSEYVSEIFDYLKKVELTTMPNPTYMETQKDLAWKMRGILIDWLVQVHSRFRLLPETLFLAVNIIDRFLSQRVVSLAKLQLVGITCMFIAAKVEEVVAPSATNFLYCADASYTETEILQAERYVLKTLDWNMSYPNPIHFLRRVSKADEYNVHVRTIAKYLLEIQCLEWRLLAAPPSLMAAASIWLARLILGQPEWTPNLAHYSSYSESQIIPTANLMLNYILKANGHTSFFNKYARKKFLKASVFVQEWALSQWPENTQVSLKDELPGLKAMILAVRERDSLEEPLEEPGSQEFFGASA